MRTVAQVMTHLSRTSKIATQIAKKVSAKESFAVGQVQMIFAELAECDKSDISNFAHSPQCDPRDLAMLRAAWNISNKRDKWNNAEKTDKLVKQVTANKRKSAAVVPNVTSPLSSPKPEWFVTVKGAAVRFDEFAPAHAFFLASEAFGAKRPVKIG